jgi:hypothetical protein
LPLPIARLIKQSGARCNHLRFLPHSKIISVDWREPTGEDFASSVGADFLEVRHWILMSGE